MAERGVARADEGASLIELLVGLGLLGLVMAGALALLAGGLEAWRWGMARVDAQQAARAGLERMAGELRLAGYDPRGAGLAAIVVAEPDRVVLQHDLNASGAIDPTRERVTYLVRGGVLRRDAGGGAQPLAEGVRALRLRYRDEAGADTADPAAVRRVRIELEVGARAPTLTLETEVGLRNAPAAPAATSP
jgi:type II secretory pathway component PulJ